MSLSSKVAYAVGTLLVPLAAAQMPMPPFLSPEWTPSVAFAVQTRPQDGGSVPRPGYIPPPLPGEVYLTVPMTWDLYQAQVTYIGGVNPQTIYGTFNVIRYQMHVSDTVVAHMASGPCFLLLPHQVPPPDQTFVVQSVAQRGDFSLGGGPTSINGTMAACATPAGGTPGHYTGDVTIEVH